MERASQHAATHNFQTPLDEVERESLVRHMLWGRTVEREEVFARVAPPASKEMGRVVFSCHMGSSGPICFHAFF